MLLMNKELKQRLLRQAPSLKPVVMLGNKGLTEAVLAEIDLALTTHELIKIKLPDPDRVLRQSQIAHICESQQADCVDAIGKVAVIYRARKAAIKKKSPTKRKSPNKMRMKKD